MSNPVKWKCGIWKCNTKTIAKVMQLTTPVRSVWDVEATDPVSGATNFTKAAKGSFSKSDLTALCPVSQWDDVFASQVDSVITNPPSDPVPDESFAVPS